MEEPNWKVLRWNKEVFYINQKNTILFVRSDLYSICICIYFSGYDLFPEELLSRLKKERKQTTFDEQQRIAKTKIQRELESLEVKMIHSNGDPSSN